MSEHYICNIVLTYIHDICQQISIDLTYVVDVKMS